MPESQTNCNLTLKRGSGEGLGYICNTAFKTCSCHAECAEPNEY